MMPKPRYDLAIIGGGIVGLATAMEMLVRLTNSKSFQIAQVV